ncbi:polysaccharide biosynthesis/export family protein [Limnohabitans sp. 63ED37-2]|uniref:polysaccharide biosynthesis/export family protein n=1 Tax=Limnohabitans sp. 63ED37-2 TaxID=1678128 RepID=UPI000706DB5D|nr:SLBB domain-containing protein [Limnohabitans sp. 63ED37-2]ALK87342.1 Polysialic acid transport protein KpsD precursor [Limnohabitans sp. 63ED37-2]
MPNNSPIFVRQTLCALLVAGLALVGGQALAQNLPSGILPNGVAPADTAAAGFAPPAALPTQPPFGLVTPPVLPQRPDLGAADVQRTALGQIRPAKPQSPSQFQRFVQASTGKLLPHFGSNLFENPLAYAADSAAPAPADYVLGPGDEVRIQIWGGVDHAGNQTLDRSGQINLPKIGTIGLNGVRVKDLEDTLRKRIATVFNSVQVNATLGKLRGITVFVVGQAQQPGTYNLSGLSTLVNAVFASGGPGVNGSMRAIELKRNGQTVTTLDLYDFIARGDKSKDVTLQPGDVIMIPPAGPRVAMTGAWDHAAIYEIKPGNTVQDVLKLGGGMPTLAAPQKALLERVAPGQNTPRQVKELVLDTQGLQATLQDGDVFTLFGISPEFSNAVTLRGNVEAPLRYSYTAGMRISDLIPEPKALIQKDYFVRKNGLVQLNAGQNVSGDRVINDVKNLLEEINWDYAAIERLDAKEVKTVLIPFNLGKAIKDKDPQHNLRLMPGDVVTVFGVKDLPVPMEKRTQFVRIGGEVKVPGIYQISPGETLPQLLERAGGLSRNAFAYGTVFSRESTRQEQQRNLEKAKRRLEQDINSQVASQLQNVTDSEKGSAVQAQIAGQKILLSRLQGLSASGRIALELDSKNPQLPALELEDGDSIIVPHKPSFVGVFGAVMAETSFIYKSGNDVAHYVEKAGPTREADLDAALLIRADGTVQSNKAGRSWLGLGNANFMTSVLNPGDTVFIPEVLDRRSAYTQFIQGAKDWTTLLYQFGLGAAALKTIRN